VIGLGSGDTVYAAGAREETASITCIEILGAQIDGLRMLQARRPYGGIEGLLGDPRATFVTGDGRSYLARSAKRYDVIEADALRPNSAFAGNLYSREYFALLASRLKPNGLAVTWAPTLRTVFTFLNVFRYAILVDGVLIGSNDPIEVDRDAIQARLDHPFTRARFERAGIDPKPIVRPLLERDADFVRHVGRSDPAILLNTDLHPKDEYGF
jgi:spermidine synthase